MATKWEYIDPNSILKADGFYISFNPGYDWPGAWRSDNGWAETAIVVDDDTFYILNGDHRSAYEGLITDGLDGCLEYFKKNSKFKSSWSE